MLYMDGSTDVNGQGFFSYTSTKTGKDVLVARVSELAVLLPSSGKILLAQAWDERETSMIPGVGSHYGMLPLIMAQAGGGIVPPPIAPPGGGGGGGGIPLAESEPIEVTWSGGPDLLIELFIPPLIKAKGGDQITITEITGNSGNTPASESITRYFLSEDSIIDPVTDRFIGERTVPSLDPATYSDGGSSSFVLPNDLPEGTYYMGACADADETVVELDEANNCETNKLAIILPLEPNQPPIANAGPDQTVECIGNSSSGVTLNGSGSSDPDGDALTYTWTWNSGTASGESPAISLPLGTRTITLIVDDGNGETATDTVIITVRDTQPPTVTAALAPAGEVEEDEGLFRVEFSCTDICNTDVTATAVLNGIPVTNGQVVKLEVDDDTETGFDDGILEIEAPTFNLSVNCTDASGNIGSATSTSAFAADDDEDDHDDEDDKDDEDNDHDEEKD